MICIGDIIDKLHGTRKARCTPAKKLRGLVWIHHALHLSGLGPNPFALRYLSHHSDPSGLIYKWMRGNAVPTETSVRRIDVELSGSGEIYHLPLFEFLENRSLSKRYVQLLLKVYENPKNTFLPWLFPNDSELAEQKRIVPTLVRNDSASLVARGDVYGFTVIIGLVREAEAMGDVDLHHYHCANMYRALPAVARLPWFRDHINLLRQCLETIHARVTVSKLLFHVDWEIIARQVDVTTHETIRERRPRNPASGRFVDLEDPIVYHSWRS